jgi:hypothetical protein
VDFDLQWTLEPTFGSTSGEVGIMDRGFTFTASSSTDVVAYRVSLARGGVPVGSKEYPDDAGIAHPTDPSKRRIDLASDPDFPSLDGTYNVEVRAIDDAGNPSAPLGGVLTLDFVAPEAPTGFAAF